MPDAVACTRRKLTAALAKVSFDGLSGTVAFEGANRRYMIGEFLNVLPGGKKQVFAWGDWLGSNNFSIRPEPAADVVWGVGCETYKLANRTGYIPPDRPDGESKPDCQKSCNCKNITVCNCDGSLVIQL